MANPEEGAVTDETSAVAHVAGLLEPQEPPEETREPQQANQEEPAAEAEEPQKTSEPEESQEAEPQEAEEEQEDGQPAP